MKYFYHICDGDVKNLVLYILMVISHILTNIYVCLKMIKTTNNSEDNFIDRRK